MHSQIAISEIAEITLYQMKVFCLKVESRSPAFKSSSGVLSLSPELRETQNAKKTKTKFSLHIFTGNLAQLH